jgi:hypothetical protein
VLISFDPAQPALLGFPTQRRGRAHVISAQAYPTGARQQAKRRPNRDKTYRRMTLETFPALWRFLVSDPKSGDQTK